MKSRIYLLLLLLLLSVSASVKVATADEEAVEIYSYEDLLTIAENPSGSYRLMADIDMNGLPWPAITFSGVFEGNNHIIVNLNNVAVSEGTRVTYDGNRKTYDTRFAGLFSILENAEVRNLQLLNMNVSLTCTGDCFLGGIAGFCSESTIENCRIIATLRLDVTGKMFGVGGIIGYGNGTVKNCSGEFVLINTDLDLTTKDEQFLGGICAAGYPDAASCSITLEGYISDHGFVHSGGLVGMYIVYPVRFARDGYLKDNTLEGFITFFEDNTNRRAYCEQRCGEIMDWQFTESGNRYRFTRDERFDYEKTLLPHGDCDCESFREAVVPPSCTEAGYTARICEACAYTFRSDYTLPKHTLNDSHTVLTAPDVGTEGTGSCTCTVCGTEVRITLPALTPSPTPTPTPSATPEQNTGTVTPSPSSEFLSEAPETPAGKLRLPFLIGGLAILIGGTALLIFRPRR